MNTSEVLNRAADLIEERGWATGNCGMATTGPACLEGALASVLGAPTMVKQGPRAVPNDLDDGTEFHMYSHELDEHPAYRAVCDYLDRRVGLFVWNDAQRDGAAVVAVLRAAALIEAAKENANVREAIPA